MKPDGVTTGQNVICSCFELTCELVAVVGEDVEGRLHSDTFFHSRENASAPKCQGTFTYTPTDKGAPHMYVTRVAGRMRSISLVKKQNSMYSLLPSVLFLFSFISRLSQTSKGDP